MSKPQLRLVRAEPAAASLTLSAAQLDAAAHRGTPLIITGATGTGKTTTLIEAAVSRINGGQSPDSILLLTYGRERASELRDAIVTRAGKTAHEPLARTFHSLAYSILKMRTTDEIRDLVLLSGAEQESFIAQLLQGDIAKGYRAADFWQRYLGAMVLQEISAGDSKMRIDPSEIINSANNYLDRNPELLAEVRKRFSTIIIDEFQESDPAQRNLLDLIAPNDLVIVADPASAVGRFRGADPEGVPAALDRYRELGAREITLTENFRGVPTTSAALFASESEEAQYIAYQFKRAHLMQGVPYSEMAVIVRSHGQVASSIRRAFAQVGIPAAGDLEALANNAAIAPFLLLARVATGTQPLNLETAEKFGLTPSYTCCALSSSR